MWCIFVYVAYIFIDCMSSCVIEELMKFCPYYNGVAAEGSKCIKFESGLRPEIKQDIGYQEIHQFSVLVSK